MATTLGITEQEILEALVSAETGPEHARTTLELVQETGVCRSTVTSALRRLHQEGRLVVHQVRRLSFDGKNRPVSAYTILPAKKKK